MAGYDKFRNHMEEPDNFIDRMNKVADDMQDNDKQLIADVATAGIVGVTAAVCPPIAIAQGILWAAKRFK